MTDDDVEPSARVQEASFNDRDSREGTVPRQMTEEIWERLTVRLRHFLTHDPAGSWVATDDDNVVGCALALKRDTLWGLSLLVVDPDVQSAGTGRKLLDAALMYAEGCDRAIILSTTDPRAMRSYATSGFALYPQVHATGRPDRNALPALHGRVRDGSVADVHLADDVDRSVRGAPRGPDQSRLASDMAMFVVDDVEGRGYAYVRGDGIMMALAASDDGTAADLLWRCLAHTAEAGEPAKVDFMNAEQQWAITVSYRARLTVTPAGPVFWRGITPPPSYLPSGAYL
jgi:GNAT superfamily N-acetyltransferase